MKLSKDKENIRTMFNSIAGKYDFLNHFFSLGIDKRWRKKIRKHISTLKHKKILDVATGTGDLAIELAKIKTTKIHGIDIAEKMIEIGQKKVKAKKLEDIVHLQTADALNIPFDDNTFDAITCAFGVRNFENLSNGLKEIYRVLKTNGTFLILEFSHPKNNIVNFFYNFYFHKILPFFGRIISKNKKAYSYLPSSVESFASGENFVAILTESGFNKTKFKTLSFGIATIYFSSK
ncbi:MAG: bifunctional demethylmenaquinone methyltransferase/2-methoxy-6-polyprenyl-1,4-benzoquinol methylase UbiE [Bacteroidota bacterium]|nr:bifunctional demethylmenaquinone methyltransferase/2-methoxy-6-polyprenyl-1,4-benzoquinol methylase UbiE [Bacteroidota bacterium]